MKKSLQKFMVEVSGGEQKIYTATLKQEFAKCTGLFVVPQQADTDFTGVTLSLKIEGKEVIPLETDAALMVFDGRFALRDALWSFKEYSIPARSSAYEVQVGYDSALGNGKTQKFAVYFLLEN